MTRGAFRKAIVAAIYDGGIMEDERKVTILEIRELHNKLLEIFNEARKTSDCEHPAQQVQAQQVQANYCFACGRNLGASDARTD